MAEKKILENKMRALLSEAASGNMGWRKRTDKAMELVAQAWDEGYGQAAFDYAGDAGDGSVPVRDAGSGNPYATPPGWDNDVQPRNPDNYGDYAGEGG